MYVSKRYLEEASRAKVAIAGILISGLAALAVKAGVSHIKAYNVASKVIEENEDLINKMINKNLNKIMMIGKQLYKNLETRSAAAVFGIEYDKRSFHDKDIYKKNMMVFLRDWLISQYEVGKGGYSRDISRRFFYCFIDVPPYDHLEDRIEYILKSRGMDKNNINSTQKWREISRVEDSLSKTYHDIETQIDKMSNLVFKLLQPYFKEIKASLDQKMQEMK